MGFDITNDYIVGVTGRSVACLSGEEILWEYIQDRDSIIAPPTIFKEKVYVPLKDSIAVFNIHTGVMESSIKLFDTITSGYKIILYKNNLYITFASGIYTYDIETGLINTDPVLPVIGAAPPCFYNNIIYITSYLTHNVRAFDMSGNNLWSTALIDRSYFPPVVINTTLIAGTYNGTLYKISLDGTIVTQIELRKHITSIINGNNRIFYVHTKENMLFQINYDSFEIEETFSNVVVVIVNNNTLMKGMTNGTIKMENIYSGIKTDIKLPYSQAFSFISRENVIFAGLKNGYILRLEYK